MENPLVSVCLITYNHEKYIRQAIEGVLMQKVNFSWEFIIADDYSTDRTREILAEYKSKYPDLIKLILQEKNVGAYQNWRDLIDSPKGKYLAYFEGDDYWTNDGKLQMQVNFLEKNPDFSFCFHETLVQYESGESENYLFAQRIYGRDVFTMRDLILNEWFISTSSVVLRREFLVLPDFMPQLINGDFAMHLILASRGKIKFIKEVMSVYRRNDVSLSSSLKVLHVYHKQIELLNLFKAHFKGKYNLLFNLRILKIYARILKFKLKNFLSN